MLKVIQNIKLKERKPQINIATRMEESTTNDQHNSKTENTV